VTVHRAREARWLPSRPLIALLTLLCVTNLLAPSELCAIPTEDKAKQLSLGVKQPLEFKSDDPRLSSGEYYDTRILDLEVGGIYLIVAWSTTFTPQVLVDRYPLTPTGISVEPWVSTWPEELVDFRSDLPFEQYTLPTITEPYSWKGETWKHSGVLLVCGEGNQIRIAIVGPAEKLGRKQFLKYFILAIPLHAGPQESLLQNLRDNPTDTTDLYFSRFSRPNGAGAFVSSLLEFSDTFKTNPNFSNPIRRTFTEAWDLGPVTAQYSALLIETASPVPEYSVDLHLKFPSRFGNTKVSIFAPERTNNSSRALLFLPKWEHATLIVSADDSDNLKQGLPYSLTCLLLQQDSPAQTPESKEASD